MKGYIFSFMILCFSVINAQTISSIEFDTEYQLGKSGIYSPIISYTFEMYQDSIIDLSFYNGNAQNRVEERKHYLINQSLQVIDTFSVWERNGSFVPIRNNLEYGLFTKKIIDQGTGTPYRYYFYHTNDSTSFIDLYTLKNDFEKDSLVFSQSFSHRPYFFEPYVNDTALVLFSQTQFLNKSDTMYVERYGMQSGQLQQVRKMFSGPQFVPDSDFTVILFHKPQAHLGNPNLIQIEGNFDERRILVLDIYSLNTVKVGGLTQQMEFDLFLNQNVSLFDARSYYVDSSGVEMAGLLAPTNSNDIQFGHVKTNWNDSVLFVKNYGSNQVQEAAVGFFKKDSISYLIGSSPRLTAPGGLPTQILIYNVSNSGYDSLLFYGQKSQQGDRVFVNDGGDLFFLSTVYNSLASDSAILFQITKVPASLLNSIPETKNKQTLLVYPNPSSDFIRSEHFVAGENFLIYDMSGKLVQRGTIPSEEHISIASFEKGTYVLQLIREKRAVSVLFVKQ